MLDPNSIPLDDTKTWELIQSGYSCGVFQCESRLVQKWLKKIKPRNIWELSAVIALVRPGPLESGFADTYVAYRNGEKAFESIGHPIIDEVLKTTDGVLIYQESLMGLGSKLAWPDLPEKEKLIKVDQLRKAVGKKDQAKLLAIGKEFVEGCIRNNVDPKIADNLFDIIKRCGRYLFNLAHSVSYAYLAYKTAYIKCHYPYQFFATYLSYAQFKLDKWEEIYNLVQEARVFGIEILSPNINKKNEHFSIEGNSIRYGLSHIKFFGGKTIDLVRSLPVINDWRQLIFLCFTDTFGKELGKRPSEALISVGAFSDLKIGRKNLLNLFRFFNKLTPAEIRYICEKLSDIETIAELPTLVQDCITNKSSKKRKDTVQSELKLLNLNEFDNPAWVEEEEKAYLGIALTASAVDNKEANAADTCVNCHGQFGEGELRQLAVVIDYVKHTTTKKGKNPGQKMACISVHDTSGELQNLPIFPEQYLLFSDSIIEKNTVQITIKRNKTGWIIQDLQQI